MIDARGRIVMPGFIDTHHHQFETALRSFLADGMLINDGSGSPSGSTTYFEFILLKFAPVYRPQDVYINELFGGLSQLDDGVTTVHDVSQIHHSPAALGRRHPGALRYRAPRRLRLFRERGRRCRQPVSGRRVPHQEAVVLLERPARHHDHGRRGLPRDRPTRQAWTIGRQLGLQIAAHILSPFGIRPIFDLLAQGRAATAARLGLGPDNLFIHMTGMSDMAWQKVKDAGAQVSIAVPDRDEHAARHAADPQDAEPGHGAVAERRTWSAR